MFMLNFFKCKLTFGCLLLVLLPKYHNNNNKEAKQLFLRLLSGDQSNLRKPS